MNTTAQDTLGEIVDTYRSANAAIRKIRKNDGRTAATTKAIQRHERTAYQAMRLLIDNKHKYIAGELTDEQHLIYRLDASTFRREQLEARLENCRRDIRRFVKLLGDRDVVEQFPVADPEKEPATA